MAEKAEKNLKVTIPSVEELLLAGAHFGHQTRRWQPQMAPYIYKVQSGIHIIDLYKTHDLLASAVGFLDGVAAKGEQVIFVGTKGQSKELVAERAAAAGALFVTERWLGGILTNFHEINKRLSYLKDYYKKSAADGYKEYTKKERLLLARDAEKMQKVLGGILSLRGLPGAVVILDPHRERIAIRECQRVGVPIVAIADTNCDPSGIDYVIPANDDAIKSIDLIISALAGAVKEGYLAAGIEPEVKTELPVEKSDNKVKKVDKEEVKEVVARTDGKADLASLGLSNRAFNALEKAGVKTVDELRKIDLESVRGLGAKSLEEIKKALA